MRVQSLFEPNKSITPTSPGCARCASSTWSWGTCSPATSGASTPLDIDGGSKGGMYDGAENALYRGAGIRARCGVAHAGALVPSSFSRDSLQLWFSPWRTLVSSSVEMLVLPVPYGAQKFFWRRFAALRRSAPSACQTAVVSRRTAATRAGAARRTRPERAARNESGQAPPSRPGPRNLCVS